MNCKWSLPVDQNASLVMQPKSSACIYYLCGIQSPQSDFIDQVELRMVSESRPEKRLQTLLERGLLDEADELAIKFKLNRQPVYEAKAKKILLNITSADPVSKVE